jgi:opacity protein-like surface antigen
MKKSMIVFFALILLTPSMALSGIITFKIGFFIPQAQSDLWEIEFENMDFGKSDYYNSNFAFSYEYFITKQLSFTLGLEGYHKNKGGVYNEYFGVLGSVFAEPVDFAFPSGVGLEGDFFADEMFNIIHSFNVSITPIQFSLKLYPMGRRGNFIPYIGGGAGLYIWYVRIDGDIVDFSDLTYTYGTDQIYPVERVFLREDNRLTLGYHAFAGLMFPVAQRFTIEAEFKYNYAQGKFKEGPDASFEGFDPFDMSGYQISFGLNYWF